MITLNCGQPLQMCGTIFSMLVLRVAKHSCNQNVETRVFSLSPVRHKSLDCIFSVDVNII